MYTIGGVIIVGSLSLIFLNGVNELPSTPSRIKAAVLPAFGLLIRENVLPYLLNDFHIII